MLNHARTLLMNVTADDPPSLGYPGDELIAPGYQRLALPTALETVRAQLFGTAPDRHMLNYRVRQLLALVHASPLEEYVLALDPRVTYDLEADDFVDDGLFLPRVYRTGGTASDVLTVVGRPSAPDVVGRCYHLYDVDVTNGGAVAVERLTPPNQKVVFDLEPRPGGTYGTPPLAGSGYSFFLATNNPGQAFRVEILNRPQFSLEAVVDSLAVVGEPVLLALFGAGREEPYQTLRGLWFRKLELPLRLGALVVALAYRTEERRLGGG